MVSRYVKFDLYEYVIRSNSFKIGKPRGSHQRQLRIQTCKVEKQTQRERSDEVVGNNISEHSYLVSIHLQLEM
jgi:hypothetical protein